jgi:hypothetical protein
MTVPVVNTDTTEHYVWCDGCDDRLLMESERPSVIQKRMPPQKNVEKRHHPARAGPALLSSVPCYDDGT